MGFTKHLAVLVQHSIKNPEFSTEHIARFEGAILQLLASPGASEGDGNPQLHQLVKGCKTCNSGNLICGMNVFRRGKRERSPIFYFHVCVLIYALTVL